LGRSANFDTLPLVDIFEGASRDRCRSAIFDRLNVRGEVAMERPPEHLVEPERARAGFGWRVLTGE